MIIYTLGYNINLILSHYFCLMFVANEEKISNPSK